MPTVCLCFIEYDFRNRFKRFFRAPTMELLTSYITPHCSCRGSRQLAAWVKVIAYSCHKTQGQWCEKVCKQRV